MGSNLASIAVEARERSLSGWPPLDAFTKHKLTEGFNSVTPLRENGVAGCDFMMAPAIRCPFEHFRDGHGICWPLE
jgi:hypothetical protein